MEVVPFSYTMRVKKTTEEKDDEYNQQRLFGSELP